MNRLKPNRWCGWLCSLLGMLAALLLVHDGSADAPAGHFVIGDELVEDSATKLIWQRSFSENAVTAEAAAKYCEALSLEGGGFRLPTVKELHTLVDESRTLPAIDGNAFPDTPPDFFWTSSTVAGFAQYTWAVSFAEGTDAWFPPEHQKRVRCVR